MAAHRAIGVFSVAVSLLSYAGQTLAERPLFWPEEQIQGYTDICPRVPIPYEAKDRSCSAPKNWFAWEGKDWSPWTQRPMCVTSDRGEQKSAAEEAYPTHCLFTKKDFGGGRGITFFTTPKIADIIKNTEAFKSPDSIKGVNNLISGAFSPPPYRAHNFPDRGIGLVANRTLYRGERIIQETPAWIYDRGIFNVMDEEDRIPMGWHGIYMLPRETRDDFLSLHAHRGGDRVDDLMHTNAFGAYFTESDMHNNVLPRISRFNHDCRPNAHYYFDPNTMTQYVHALKEIAPGEEILINYTDGEYTFEQRQAATMVSWGFACRCSICRQPADHVMASDQRLKLIKETKEILNDWNSLKLDRAKMAEFLIGLYQQERLWAPLATGYEAAAYAYSVVGDEYKAKEFAGRAVEALTILYGSDHELTVDLEKMMLDPKSHRTWKFNVAEKDDDDLEEPTASI